MCVTNPSARLGLVRDDGSIYHFLYRPCHDRPLAVSHDTALTEQICLVPKGTHEEPPQSHAGSQNSYGGSCCMIITSPVAWVTQRLITAVSFRNETGGTIHRSLSVGDSVRAPAGYGGPSGVPHFTGVERSRGSVLLCFDWTRCRSESTPVGVLGGPRMHTGTSYSRSGRFLSGDC